ncbi:MAG: monofunctional biosynthetic peptidoglycan transglycosylase [Paracoccaceae bacterium]
MATAKKTKAKKSGKTSKSRAHAWISMRPMRWVVRWGSRIALASIAVALFLVVLFSVINPPTTMFMASESWRLGGVQQNWVDLEGVDPIMARAVVAGEDANFCNHWGFDLAAIRAALDAGSKRGASTISQQTVKNVYLWHGRSWVRKVIEAGMTPMVEAVWTKRRIIEVYLNIAEFDEGVFGVHAAAKHYFGVSPDKLSNVQAARLAAVLPSPKTRSASKPSAGVRKRAAAILDGAATIRADGRSACFES